MDVPLEEPSRFTTWLRRAIFGAALVMTLVIGGTAVRVWQEGRVDDRTSADAIVVLGAAQYNGTPSEIFQARLEHAKQLYDEGVAATVITVGGGKVGDRYTEGEVGARWLNSQGLPTSNTLTVAEGSDTLGSLRAVADVVRQRGWHTAVLVSDPWHSLRARTMAEDVGLDVWTSPTHRGPIVQTRETQVMYIFRETGALLFYRLTKNPADDIGATSIG
jgi:uncharacterized SAM-binding protein YcdF (DUF218 family)